MQVFVYTVGAIYYAPPVILRSGDTNNNKSGENLNRHGTPQHPEYSWGAVSGILHTPTKRKRSLKAKQLQRRKTKGNLSIPEGVAFSEGEDWPQTVSVPQAVLSGGRHAVGATKNIFK